MGNADSGFLLKEKGALSMQDQFDNFCKKMFAIGADCRRISKFF